MLVCNWWRTTCLWSAEPLLLRSDELGHSLCCDVVGSLLPGARRRCDANRTTGHGGGSARRHPYLSRCRPGRFGTKAPLARASSARLRDMRYLQPDTRIANGVADTCTISAHLAGDRHAPARRPSALRPPESHKPCSATTRTTTPGLRLITAGAHASASVTLAGKRSDVPSSHSWPGGPAESSRL